MRLQRGERYTIEEMIQCVNKNMAAMKVGLEDLNMTKGETLKGRSRFILGDDSMPQIWVIPQYENI